MQTISRRAPAPVWPGRAHRLGGYRKGLQQQREWPRVWEGAGERQAHLKLHLQHASASERDCGLATGGIKLHGAQTHLDQHVDGAQARHGLRDDAEADAQL